MLVVFSAVAKPEFTVAGGRRQTKSSSTVRNFSTRDSSAYRSEDSYQSQPQFTLEGKPVYLQQRLSLVSPIRESVRQLRSQKKTYSCFIEKAVEEKTVTREAKVNTKRFSGGVRRASIRRRQEQQKPSTEVVYQQRQRRKGQGPIQRQPLAMSTMNLPGKHLPRYCSCEETTQVYPSTEEAKATLKRLLASRNHESMMSESISSESCKQESGEKGGLLEKPAYLEDTYDYLFNRHVQTLNGVIKKQEQEKLDETNCVNQQKYKKQVIQLCVRGGDNSAAEDDASVILGSTKSSTRQNSGNTLHGGGDSRRYRSTENDSCCNNNHPTQEACSCSSPGNKSSVTEQSGLHYNNRAVRINDYETGSTDITNNNNTTNKISVNLVTSQIHELELQEIAPPKPLIIFNHVPTPSDSSLSMDTSEQSEPTQSRLSPPRSRSPTPLLEVPFPVKDLTSEMKRPPIN